MNKRRKFTSSFKTKAVLEALSERFTIQELAHKQEVHPNQINQWKAHFIANAEGIFEKPKTEKSQEDFSVLKEKSINC